MPPKRFRLLLTYSVVRLLYHEIFHFVSNKLCTENNYFSFPAPREKMARRRPKTNSEGGRNPFPQTPRLPSALSQRRAERDATTSRDFRRKKFELCPKSSTNSRKTENRPKKAKCKYQVESGAEFPPETPLPPRPHFCWPFWELREQMQTAHGAKKRGRGRVWRKKRNMIFFIENNI